MDRARIGSEVVYDWGEYGWCSATVTDFYDPPKTKHRYNFELTYPKTSTTYFGAVSSTTPREIRNHLLTLEQYPTRWFVVAGGYPTVAGEE